jgi:tetratricopeptide (TPR) repeat protein
VIALAIAVLVVLAGAAAATPAQELADAREQFRSGKFSDAAKALNYLLYPNPRLSQDDDLVEAHVLLAVSAFEIGDRRTATREFEEALFLDPGVTLDKLLFSESAREFFDDVKQDYEEREAAAAEARALAERAAELQAALDAMVVIEKRPYYINFIPFGAGQFQNEQRGKGLFFAVSEGITGGLSAGIWLYLVGEYGLPGKVPPEEADRARRLQEVEVVAGGLCLGLMAWGIVDSLLNYKPSVRQEPDESLLPEKFRKKKPAPPASSFRLEPTALPGGAGISLTWEH